MKYHEIRELIVESSRSSRPNNISELQETLARVSENFNLQRLADSILNDCRYMNEIAVMSYSHGLGFDKIIIAPYASGSYQLRLNIWWENPEKTTGHYEDIHNHRWDFSTTLLLGNYTYENFRVTTEGEEFLYYHYLPDTKGKNELTYIGRKRLTMFSSGSLMEGGLMSCAHFVLHRIKPQVDRHPVITLFLTGKPNIRRVSVFREKQVDDIPHDHLRSSMTVEELKEKLERLGNLV